MFLYLETWRRPFSWAKILLWICFNKTYYIYLHSGLRFWLYLYTVGIFLTISLAPLQFRFTIITDSYYHNMILQLWIPNSIISPSQYVMSFKNTVFFFGFLNYLLNTNTCTKKQTYMSSNLFILIYTSDFWKESNHSKEHILRKYVRWLALIR